MEKGQPLLKHRFPNRFLNLDYNLLRGRVWPLFLLTGLVSALPVKSVKHVRSCLDKRRKQQEDTDEVRSLSL